VIRNIAQLLYWGTHYSGANKAWIKYLLKKRDVKLMLNYHHIVKDEAFVQNLTHGYSHRLSAFDAQMAYLSENFKVNTDIDDYNSITITFDDGAKSNFTNAHGLLEKYGLKAWFFLNDRHLDTSPQRTLWVDEMYEWLSHAKTGSYAFGSFSKDLTNDNLFEFEQHLFDHLVHNFDELDAFISFIRSNTHFDLNSNADRFAPMSLDELAHMKAYGHELGFHTRNHYMLGSISSEVLANELVIPDYLKNVINRSEVLSIPFGIPKTVNSKVFQEIFDAGYKTILLNEVRSKGADIKGRINVVNSSELPKISSYLARWPLFLFER